MTAKLMELMQRTVALYGIIHFVVDTAVVKRNLTFNSTTKNHQSCKIHFCFSCNATWKIYGIM